MKSFWRWLRVLFSWVVPVKPKALPILSKQEPEIKITPYRSLEKVDSNNEILISNDAPISNPYEDVFIEAAREAVQVRQKKAKEFQEKLPALLKMAIKKTVDAAVDIKSSGVGLGSDGENIILIPSHLDLSNQDGRFDEIFYPLFWKTCAPYGIEMRPVPPGGIFINRASVLKAIDRLGGISINAKDA